MSEDRYWIEEVKTASRVDDYYLSRLHYDPQSIGYLSAAREFLGLNVVGIVYRIGVKCQLRLKKTESVPEYFERVKAWYQEPGRIYTQKFTVDERAVADFWDQLWQVKEEVAHSMRTGYWPKSRARCNDYNRPCAYQAICDSFENPTIIENDYEYVAPHEELRV